MHIFSFQFNFQFMFDHHSLFITRHFTLINKFQVQPEPDCQTRQLPRRPGVRLGDYSRFESFDSSSFKFSIQMTQKIRIAGKNRDDRQKSELEYLKFRV